MRVSDPWVPLQTFTSFTRMTPRDTRQVRKHKAEEARMMLERHGHGHTSARAPIRDLAVQIKGRIWRTSSSHPPLSLLSRASASCNFSFAAFDFTMASESIAVTDLALSERQLVHYPEPTSTPSCVRVIGDVDEDASGPGSLTVRGFFVFPRHDWFKWIGYSAASTFLQRHLRAASGSLPAHPAPSDGTRRNSALPCKLPFHS